MAREKARNVKGLTKDVASSIDVATQYHHRHNCHSKRVTTYPTYFNLTLSLTSMLCKLLETLTCVHTSDLLVKNE